MADLRLIAVLLVACADAGAQPPVPSPKPPTGWTPQPAIVTAAKDALGKKATIEGIEAFGEPAMGCYSVWMAVRASGKATELADQLVKGLTEPDKKRKIEIKDVVKPTAEEEGVLALSFETPPYSGRLRARLGKGRITALACWSAQREPVACAQACTIMLGALP